MTRRLRRFLLFLGLLAWSGIPLAGLFAASHLAASVTVINPLGLSLRGEIDNLVLRNLKLTFRLRTQQNGELGLPFLAALPRVRRLEIQDAEVLVAYDGGPQRLELTSVNVVVKDFSPNTGGEIALGARFAFAGGGNTGAAAHGTLKGTFQVGGVSPRPHGRGSVALVLDSGTYRIGGRPISLAGLAMTADLAYDQRTETVTLNALHVQSPALGTVEGTAQAILRGAMPWHADLSAPAIDVAHVFAVLKPFLPKEYADWTTQGQGRVRAHVRGVLGSDGSPFEGTVTCTLAQGGFSSPDSTRAAQGVNADLSLKVAYVAVQRRLAVGVRAEQRAGEYLWGTYYNNFARRRASLTADGDITFAAEQRFALSGVVDVFQTGDYSFEASGTSDAWTLRATAINVSHAAVVDAVLREYLTAVSPALATLSLSGASSLHADIRTTGGTTAITGIYRMDGAHLDAPDVGLSIHGIAANVPFALRYPQAVTESGPSRDAGFIRFQTLQRGGLFIDSLRVPVFISQNRLEVPEPIVVPFFGGRVHLYGLQVNDVLFPSRYRVGVKVDDVDLGRLTQRLTGVEYPGRINADLGMMRYENNRAVSEGKAVVAVFGGEVEATDLFAENLASPSRRAGGDIVFRRISLEELTGKIAIGKMTGVIQGSLRDFVMEYGEPARFHLEVESVETSGIEQRISTEAIQSISILGTGADSAVNRGITQFFKAYPYSKIGIRCVLRNDQFSVNGTIREGGTEYLIRRGFLRGVDVINRNPDNVISFRDMAERVKRIYRTPEVEPGGTRVE